eukprot:Nitzschia sp. Nitz4//scaffold13_size275219//244974//248609//NITZ4_000923-RA/size275219-augustus-gene-0.275-mRNA-1//-1//CDS//3329536161//5358//frame0
MAIDTPSIASSCAAFRLEAIFHPKFENEEGDRQVRSKMIGLVQDQAGYLEVSLKHSGSLVLWSGGQRFYAKNSTDNQFTAVAEILLRQHFERVWRSAGKETINAGDIYEECSNYLESSRLTCAFEVITALTQRFRLPHNDSWVFTSPRSTSALFRIYDGYRETGTASNTIEALSSTAECHIPSIHPHLAFQGEILEGFVIRYIPFRDQTPEQVQHDLQELSTTAHSILQQVPPNIPPSFEIHDESSSILLGTNIRAVFENLDGYRKGLLVAHKFAESLSAILNQADNGERRVTKRCTGVVDLPTIAENVNSVTYDLETPRIASLLSRLHGMKKGVTYTFLEEKLPSQPERTLCIIHVLHDGTFRQFQSSKDLGAMNLFRGFVFELVQPSEGTKDLAPMTLAGGGEPAEEHEPLMLKMKMLPYMVRTFICRNQLKLLQKGDVESFMTTARTLLERWGISHQGKQKWLPFFEKWGVYAKAEMSKQPNPDSDLPPLSDFSYLKHIEHFTHLYETGAAPSLPKVSPNMFRGLVLLIAPTAETAKASADLLGKKLSCTRVLRLGDAMRDFADSGVVCYEHLEKYSPPKARAFLETTVSYLCVVMVDCTDSDLEVAATSSDGGKNSSRFKKMRGIRNVVEKQDCCSKIHLKSDSLQEVSSEAADTVVSQIKESVASMPEDAANPGLFVFFPGIPGCGKSSVLTGMDKELQEQLKLQSSSDDVRNVKMLSGDELGKAFWGKVHGTRKRDPPCILIGDKNAAPASWDTIGSHCRNTGAVPLPVLPDPQILQTTRIKGSMDPNGMLDSGKSHFYPFSLRYLAICMARVLQREASSHAGKLDQGTPTAAMIVVSFYAFYRYHSAEELLSDLVKHLHQSDSMSAMEPVVIPFLREDAKDTGLPDEVEAVLLKALRLQMGYKNKPATNAKDASIKEMESELRQCMKIHGPSLLSHTASLADSRARLLEQLIQRCVWLDQSASVPKPNEPLDSVPKIKLVSLDVESKIVHQILQAIPPASLQGFHDMVVSQLSSPDNPWDSPSWVTTTHVTMAFWQTMVQTKMRHLFGKLIGQEVELKVVALWWNSQVSALEVQVPSTTIQGSSLPPCENSFPHITVWFAQGASARMSNDLPGQLEKGESYCFRLDEPVTLTGTVSFWNYE